MPLARSRRLPIHIRRSRPDSSERRLRTTTWRGPTATVFSSLLATYFRLARDEPEAFCYRRGLRDVVPRVAACSRVLIAVSRALSAASRRFCAAARSRSS